MQITKQRKLIICVLMLLVVIASAVLLITNVKSAKAEAMEPNENLNFTLITNEDGNSTYKVAIKPVYKTTVEFVVIPENYNGLPVTEVATSGFMSCIKLAKVVLPKSVTKIGNNAFMNCANLTQISMPNVHSIGSNAFGMCATLERLFIPYSVTEVGSNILRNNSNTLFIQSTSEVVDTLWSSTWSNYFTGDIVYSADPEDVVGYREILATDNQTVVGYELLEYQFLAAADSDVVIYNSVCVDEELGYLPVLNICPEAFTFSEMNSLTIKDRNKDDPEVPSFTHKINIRSNAFMGAIISEINIEVGVTFNHPENLQMEYLTSMVDDEPIVGNADGYSIKVFDQAFIDSITLPSDIEIITDYMFFGCTYLKNIKIAGVEYDGNNVLPNVKSIGAEAFNACTSLENIFIPESVSVIGESAFYNWGVNTDGQDIYIECYDDEFPEGWETAFVEVNWATLSIYPKQYIEIKIVLFDEEYIIIKVKPGYTMPEINEKLEREGYTFNGIYSGTNYDATQYYDKDLVSKIAWNEGDPETLYAKWHAISYKISYNVDLKGQVNPNPTEYNVTDSFTFVSLEAKGYSFKWSPEKISEGTTGDLTVVGTWTPVKYKITYVVDDWKGNSNPNSDTYTIEDAVNFKKLESNGYEFYWYPNKIDRNTTGDITVVGSWSVIEYEIDYQVPTWKFNNFNGPDTYTVEDDITFDNLVAAGYTFAWSPASIKKGTTGNLTVVGTWKIEEYTITYKVDDLKGNTNPNSTTYTVEDRFIITPLHSRGYNFYWNRTQVELGTTGNLTIVGTWEIIVYTIDYEVDLCGLTNPNPKTYTVEDEITFIELERVGYNFHWTPDKIEKGSVGDITVSGKWTKLVYNITYDVDLKGLNNPNPESYTVEEEIIFIKLEKAGYTFEWYPNKINVGTTGKINVKGVWTPIDYQIKYVVWNGTINPNPSTYNVDNNVTFATAIYNGYNVTWDIASTYGKYEDITVKASYFEKSFDQCYNSVTGRFELYTVTQLNELRNVSTSNTAFYVDVNYQNAVWTPIQGFYGTLTGSVKGIRLEFSSTSQYYGFIITNYGTISDFNLDGTLYVKNSITTVRYAGLLCGRNVGTISDCTVKSTTPLSFTMGNGVSASVGIRNDTDRMVRIGGLVGTSDYNAAKLINCKNYLNIYGYGTVAGIAVSANGNVTNCENYGTLRHFNTNGLSSTIGGIAAYGSAVFSNCLNYGNIYFMSASTISSSSFKPCIGMIVGELYYESDGRVYGCTNYGTFNKGYLTDSQTANARGDLVGYYWEE